MSIMNEKKFGRILETGMGFIMSWVLNTSAMYLLGAPMTPAMVFPAWVGAFAIAVAINYFAPVILDDAFGYYDDHGQKELRIKHWNML